MGNDISNEAKAITDYLAQKRAISKTLWIYKIPDLGGRLKPFDVIGVDTGTPFAYEFKFVKADKIDKDKALKLLEPHQNYNLKKFKDAGGIAKIICYCAGSGDYLHFDI